MQSIKCFEVYGNTDTTEGRGPMKLVVRFSSYETAVQYVKSPAYAWWCVMGYQNEEYDLLNIREADIVILDSLSEFEANKKKELKAAALSKLSKEEREALGV